MGRFEGISHFQELFMLLWIKRGWYTSDCSESSYIENTFSGKNSSYKCPFCTKVCAPSKYKDIPTKTLKQHARTNSSQQILNICVWSVQTNKPKNDEYTYTAIQKLWSFSVLY